MENVFGKMVEGALVVSVYFIFIANFYAVSAI